MCVCVCFVFDFKIAKALEEEKAKGEREEERRERFKFAQLKSQQNYEQSIKAWEKEQEILKRNEGNNDKRLDLFNYNSDEDYEFQASLDRAEKLAITNMNEEETQIKLAERIKNQNLQKQTQMLEDAAKGKLSIHICLFSIQKKKIPKI